MNLRKMNIFQIFLKLFKIVIMQKLKNKIEELIDTSKYEEVCELVKEKFGIEYECKFLKNDYHFNNDTSTRDIYIVTIKRGNRQFNFNFGQSIMNSQYYQDRIPDRTYSLDGKSIQTKKDLKEFCINNQPYYKKHIPEVYNYFKQKYLEK